MGITNPTALKSDGWTRIGLIDTAGRRSLWVKLSERQNGEELPIPERIDICSGREGDDWECSLLPDNPVFLLLWDVLDAQVAMVEYEAEMKRG